MTEKRNWLERLFGGTSKKGPGADVGHEIPSSNAALTHWLVSNLARHVNVEVDEISETTSFTEQGLDSLAMVRFSGEIEEWLGLKVDPTLLYEYRNIESLTSYLAQELSLQSPK